MSLHGYVPLTVLLEWLFDSFAKMTACILFRVYQYRSASNRIRCAVL